MTFEKTWGILWSMANGCVDCDEDWCESHHDNCGKCRKEALENLKSAHEEEINHARKVEYHRGYNDGRKSVSPDEWQLEQHRRCVADRLREYRDAPPVQTLEIGNGDAIEVDAYTFGGILSAVMYPVTEFPTSMFIDKLIYLLVGEMPEGADSAIYGNWEKVEVGTKTTASNLQKSPDLTGCHELGKLLKKTLGEAKCIHDRLKDQSKSHADLKDENQRLKGECRMYRTMLNDAAESYKRERDKLVEQCAEYERAVTGHRERAAASAESERLRRELEVERDELSELRHNVALWRDRSEGMRKQRDDAESERDRYKAACEATQFNRDRLDEIVRHCLDDAVMYRGLLNDAKEDYVRLVDERDELNAYANDQHEKLRDAELKIQQLESRCEMESNSCSKAIDERDRYKAACEAERDKLRRNVERFMLHGSKDYIELPKGEDGEHIRMGDTVRVGLSGEPFEVGVITFYAKGNAFVADESNKGTRAKYCHHVTQPDPIEDAIHEYELGNLSRVQMIERIRDATAPR